MRKQIEDKPILLMVGNAEEVRAGIKRLLEMDGYRVMITATEQEAVERARRERPDLLLVDLCQPPPVTVAAARRIRRRARLNRDVPVVAFPLATPGVEDADATLRYNVHVTYLIAFEQLEKLLGCLLYRKAGYVSGY